MKELRDLLETGVLDEELQPSEWDTLQAAFKPNAAREPVNPWENAAVNWVGNPGVSATGYADAATILTNWVLQTGGHQDFLVYAILFLYRHYLELRLKEIIEVGNGLTRGRQYAPTGHRLTNLWAQVRELARALKLRTGEDWQYVGQCIDELSQLDPASQTFRYSTERDGSEMCWNQPGSEGGKQVTHVNLRSLLRTMARVVMMLDGLRDGLWAMQDAR